MTKKTAQEVMENEASTAIDQNDQNETKKDKMIGKKSKKSASKKLEKEMKELQEKHGELQDKYLRLFAEFENYRKRTSKENLDLRKFAAQDTMMSLLPVIDDFDRAKQSNEDEKSEERWSDGVTMVYNRLMNIMTNSGLSAMETNGEAFDPELHEAITEIPAPTEEMKGKIIDTVEKGYQLKDKIIRHAKVVVGK